MSNQPEDHVPTPGEAVKPTLVDRGKKAAAIAERTAAAADGASNAISAIKWTAIAIVALTFAGAGYGIYQVVSAPAKMVGSAAGAVSDGVKSGASKIKDGSAGVINRLDISVPDRASFNAASKAAFEALQTMEPTQPAGVKDRMTRAKNFAGNEGRVCNFSVDLGAGALPVTIAADNKAHATAKALGSQNDRLIRFVIAAPDDNIAMRVQWDNEAKLWAPAWPTTTIKKPVTDDIAASGALKVLNKAGRECR